MRSIATIIGKKRTRGFVVSGARRVVVAISFLDMGGGSVDVLVHDKRTKLATRMCDASLLCTKSTRQM